MSMEYTIPKGVFDVFPHHREPWKDIECWHFVESTLRKAAADYGFKEIRTPLFEKTELFTRGVGEATDIVSKEMYTFLDRAQRSLSLRPEGTASVMRAFVENRLDQAPGLKKYFYLGPMFRYERPQSGRYRQHHQFGAEAIGIGKPEQDVEMIDFLCEIYRRLGLKNLTVMINSVGDEQSRSFYRQALIDFLSPQASHLSEESRIRLEKNPLRILDSKNPQDQQLIEKAPSILDFLSDHSRDHFEQVKELLAQLNIPFQVNHRLVRGLDYYNQTVFECVAHELGAQNTIGAGGRYDGLIASLGGPNLPSVGFATGLERLIQTMLGQNLHLPEAPSPFIFLVPLGEKSLKFCFHLTSQLRHLNIPSEIDLSLKKVQHGLQLANAEKAVYCAVIGDQEMETNHVQIKHMKSRTTQTVSLSDLIHVLKELYGA